MKLLMLLEKHLIIGLAAAAGMHSLMERQQDLPTDPSDATVVQRAGKTAKTAVAFANALWAELVQNGA